MFRSWLHPSTTRSWWQWRRARWGVAFATVVATVSAVAGVSMPAHADAAVDLLNCYQTTTGSVSFSATTMTQGQEVTVSWRTNWPVTCYANASLWLIGEPGLAINPETGQPNPAAPLPLYRRGIYLANSYPAALSGSISLAVPVTSYWTLWFDTGLGNRVLSGPIQTTVNPALPVTLPDDRNVYITQSGTAQRETFVRAMVTPNAIVNVAGDVNLDLTGVDHIHVASGVRLVGDRTRNPRGPRLFTTSYPELLLMIGDDGAGVQSDAVRISDVRMDGGEDTDDPCQWAGAPGANDAVEVYSSRHVEIDHSEFYGWSGAAVNIHDGFNRINRDSGRDGVWVHDNWMHDNQHPTFCEFFPIGSGHGGGYGVAVTEGGFPLIERNVFNNNRHAIAGHGSTGDGYLVYDNLFLHPGVDSVRTGFTFFNHQIDMHGLETCPDISSEHFNCGQAGEYGDIAYNTVVSNDSDAIQLRGKPTSYYNPVTGFVNPAGGMRVHNNAFAQSKDDALTQTQQGLFDDGGNFYDRTSLNSTFGYLTNSPACDFDGDGLADGFRASGVTWWYYSSVLDRWVFLARSSVETVTLGDVNSDGLCDVTGGGAVITMHPTIFAGHINLGSQADFVEVSHDPSSVGIPMAFSIGDGTLNARTFARYNFADWARVPGARPVSGDFNNDGKTDIALLPGPNTSWWYTIPVAFSNVDGSFRIYNVAQSDFAGWSQAPGAQPVAGDFNNDGRTDIALVGGAGWNTVPVAFSNGDGSFTVTNVWRGDFATSSQAPGVHVLSGDFNNDGKTDIALLPGPYTSWFTIPVAFSNGDGSFTVTNVGHSDFAGWSQAPGVHVLSGDFNNDGKTDIALLPGPNTSWWYTMPVAFSNGDGSFTVTNVPQSDFAGWSQALGAQPVAGDFNGDGKTDLALTGGIGWNTVPLAFSRGDGTFIVFNRVDPRFPDWSQPHVGAGF